VHRRRARGTDLGQVDREAVGAAGCAELLADPRSGRSNGGALHTGTGRDIESHAAAHQFRSEVVASVATVRRLRVCLIGRGGFRGIAATVGGVELEPRSTP